VHTRRALGFSGFMLFNRGYRIFFRVMWRPGDERRLCMSALEHQWYCMFCSNFRTRHVHDALFYLNVTRHRPNIKFNALVDLLIRIRSFAIKTDFG
jgi:hypothetical protein